MKGNLVVGMLAGSVIGAAAAIIAMPYIKPQLNRIVSNLQHANKMGVRIVVGSDSFCSSLTPYGKFAISEMITLWKSGLTPMEALMAATKNGAEMLKIDDITGTLEKGKFADLLVVDLNPLEDIASFSVEKMDVIMKEGTFVRGA